MQVGVCLSALAAQDTIAAIVRAAQLPMSILIVGIGDSEFKNMEIL